MKRLLVVVLLALGACSSSESAEPDRTVTVFAAASLKATFTELGKHFEQSHPGVEVSFNFAGSSDLVAQLQQGARADVFAAADEANMKKATDAALVDSPTVFARNTLTIVVPSGNPKGVNGFADLTRPDLQVVTCAPQVPCGAAAQKIEKATRVDVKPVSEESSVTDVLGKVTTGQADAGLVYVTDVTAAARAKVTAVAFPESSGAVNAYPIGVLGKSELGAQFAAVVTGPEGRKVLTDAGFQVP